MPFNNELAAQTTAFDQGCGLHCLAGFICSGIEDGTFEKGHEEYILIVLLEAFKEYYPEAADLTIGGLKKLISDDLQNSVHREVVLSRVLRNMAEKDEDKKNYGAQLTAEQVLKIANKFDIRVESYESLEGQVKEQHDLPYNQLIIARLNEMGLDNTPINRQSIHKELSHLKERKIRATLLQQNLNIHDQNNYRQISNELFPEMDTIRQQMRDNGFDENEDALQGLPQTPDQNAPRLKLHNKGGNHWEWEARSKAAADAHNAHYGVNNHAHISFFSTNNSSGLASSVHAAALQHRVNQGLQRRRQGRAKAVQEAITSYESEVTARQQQQARMQHTGAGMQSSSQMPSATGTNAASNPLSGLMNFFGSLFNGTNNPLSGLMNLGGSSNPLSGLTGLFGQLLSAYMPALTAPASAPVMETAIPVVKNIFQVLGDFFNPSDSQQDRTEFEQYLNLISNDTESALRTRLEAQYRPKEMDDDSVWATISAQVSQRLTPSAELRKRLQEQYNRKDDSVWAELSQHLLQRKLVSHEKAKEIAKRGSADVGAGGIFGVIFGFISKGFGIAENLFAVNKQMQESDPARPLSREEANSPDGALLEKYIKFLPKEAEAAKKKLYSEWRNPAISRDTVFSNLRTALGERGLKPEQEALLFDQYLAKLNSAKDKEQLQVHYQRTGGSPLVWKNLSEQLLREGKVFEATYILSRDEMKALHIKLNTPTPAFKAAHDFYQNVLNDLSNKTPSAELFRMRSEMLKAIESGNSGEQILKSLREINQKAKDDENMFADVFEHLRSEYADRSRNGTGTNHSGKTIAPAFTAQKASAAAASRQSKARASAAAESSDLSAERRHRAGLAMAAD